MSEDSQPTAAVVEEEPVREKEESDVEERPVVQQGEGEEAEEPEGMAENHKEMARDMFEKITDYLNGELSGGSVANGGWCFREGGGEREVLRYIQPAYVQLI